MKYPTMEASKISLNYKKYTIIAVSSTIIFLLALSLRLEYNQNTVIKVPAWADDRLYTVLAMNLARDGVYSDILESPRPLTAKVTPGFPFFFRFTSMVQTMSGST